MSENRNNAAIAPAVERTLGKGEVACSNHAGSTIFPHVKNTKALLHKRYPMFDMLDMCVNEARIVTCIVNHTRTDRETQKSLQDYLGVVGGVWRVLCFRNG